MDDGVTANFPTQRYFGLGYQTHNILFFLFYIFTISEISKSQER